jgi:hypothetical protein
MERNLFVTVLEARKLKVEVLPSGKNLLAVVSRGGRAKRREKEPDVTKLILL